MIRFGELECLPMNENIENPLSWNGSNLLGFALMEVRYELIKVCKNYNKLNLG